MQREYARIARQIGKALGERQEAAASGALPQRLADLMLMLSDKESRRDGAEGAVVRFTGRHVLRHQPRAL